MDEHDKIKTHVDMDKNGSNNIQTTVQRVMWMNLDQNTVSDRDEQGSNYTYTRTKKGVILMNMTVITPRPQQRLYTA